MESETDEGKKKKVHFPAMPEQKPAMTSEYTDECAKLLKAFGERFQDRNSKQKELNLFANQFKVKLADVPDNLQHEITELQSNIKLKVRYNKLPLPKFCKYILRIFPILRDNLLL